MKHLSRIVVATGIFIVLGFGASSLLVNTANALTCQDDGSTFLGSCSSEAECEMKCDLAHPEIPPEETDGRCQNGCCICLF